MEYGIEGHLTENMQPPAETYRALDALYAQKIATIPGWKRVVWFFWEPIRVTAHNFFWPGGR